jgi:hypothetical protein
MSSRIGTRKLTLLVAVAGALGGIAGGCDDTASGSDFHEAPPASSSDASSGDAASPGSFGDGGAKVSGDCPEETKLVYVVSLQDDLYSFDPPSLTFRKIGRIACASRSGEHPTSMAVDRTGSAWINYSDGAIQRVSVKDASCADTPFRTGQHGWRTFGMGFTANGPKSVDETLYVHGISGDGEGRYGFGLGRVDTSTLQLDLIGDFAPPLSRRLAELTGTGEGKLYGMLIGSPAYVAEVDKATGHAIATMQVPAIDTSSGYAFSFWGGDFWLYTADNVSLSSNVTRLKASTDNSTEVVLRDIGFAIVGAGVSTCAPLVGPR